MNLLILLFSMLTSHQESPQYFTLISSDCAVTGPVENGTSLSTWEGTSWIATCTVKDGKLSIAGMEQDSKKPLGNETCDYFEIDGIGFAESEGGGIHYVFYFPEKHFSYGQVNTLVDKGVVVTKTCVGRIELGD